MDGFRSDLYEFIQTRVTSLGALFKFVLCVGFGYDASCIHYIFVKGVLCVQSRPTSEPEPFTSSSQPQDVSTITLEAQSSLFYTCARRARFQED